MISTNKPKYGIHYLTTSRYILILLLLVISFQRLTANEILSPDFTALDSQGKVFHLKENRGNIIILYFSASWCAPCADELESLLHLTDEVGHPRIFLINITEERDPDLALNNMIDTYKFTRVIPDPSKRIGVALFNSTLLPKLIIIDQDGFQVLTMEGINNDMTTQTRATLRRLLKAY